MVLITGVRSRLLLKMTRLQLTSVNSDDKSRCVIMETEVQGYSLSTFTPQIVFEISVVFMII